MNDNRFDDIRPYYDSELPEALKRIAAWELFPQVARFIYPDLSADEARKRLYETETIHGLQSTFMNDAIKRIIDNTTSGFTYTGADHLKRGQSYLFISNHRDITLDAFLLQHVLIERKGQTSYIVFGDNLLSLPIMTDLFRSNRLIRTDRGGTRRAYYLGLQHLSEYMHYLIEQEHQSVWIAQRNGRGKDGIDRTAPAIVKMLALGSNQDSLQALVNLHIVPMSISYEWDPCDLMKVNELYQSRQGEYHKAPDEDLNSVVTGIIAPKGKVHLSIGTPMTRAELCPPEGVELADHVATQLDRRIQGAYSLMSTNYLAYDMLNGTHKYHNKYTEKIKHQFEQRLEQLAHPEKQQILIEMYANPVISALKL